MLAHARQLARTPAKIDYFATSLPTLLLFDEDLQARQCMTARLLEAQANFCLGRKANALKLAREVLASDPSRCPSDAEDLEAIESLGKDLDRRENA